jgi:hypothetical protein
MQQRPSECLSAHPLLSSVSRAARRRWLTRKAGHSQDLVDVAHQESQWERAK